MRVRMRVVVVVGRRRVQQRDAAATAWCSATTNPLPRR